MTLTVEILDRFRANQAATSCHQDIPGLQAASPPDPPNIQKRKDELQANPLAPAKSDAGTP
jgi:hypothetical protein